MMGKTHKTGGMFCAVAGFLLLKHNNLLLSDVNELVQLAVIYPFATWGSTLPDTDHDWESCPDKGVPNYLINKVLHLATPVYRRLDSTLSYHEKSRSILFKFAKIFSASHRSWQTHSDITLLAVLYLLYKVMSGSIGGGTLGGVDTTILTLILAGISIGVTAHFVLDMLNYVGIWFTFGVLVNKIAKRKILPERLRLVPKLDFFSTGDGWEGLVYRLVKIATVVSVVVFLLTYIRPDLLSGLSISIK